MHIALKKSGKGFRWKDESIQYCSGARARLPDSPSICSGRSSCKWCPTVSPPLCTTLCSTCEGSWELLFYYLRQTRHSRGCFHPRTSAPRLHAPIVSKITSKYEWNISIKPSPSFFISVSSIVSSLNNHAWIDSRTILLSQTKSFQCTISNIWKYFTNFANSSSQISFQFYSKFLSKISLERSLEDYM